MSENKTEVRTAEVTDEDLMKFMERKQKEKESRREWGKRWRAKNPEKVRQYGKEYRERKAAKDRVFLEMARERGLIE